MKVCKSLIALMLLFFIGVFALVGCNDTDDGSYVAPITLGEKIHGHWTLNSMKQVDELAQTSVDLSGQLEFMSFGIDLQADEDNNPSTFSVTGNAPALLPTSGYWDMANKFTNSDGTANKIYLYSDALKQTKVAMLTVTATPGVNRVLEFKLTRKQNGLAFVSYVYNLVPITAE